MYSKIANKTFSLIFEKKYQLMKALLIPFILLTIIEYFSTPEVKENIGEASFYLLLLLSFFITIIMSITIHRILLLDEDKTPTWGIYKYGSREISFILKAIGLGLILGLGGFLLFLLTSFGETLLQNYFGKTVIMVYGISMITIILVFLGVIFSRVSLVFPAVAIDKPIDFAEAFSISKDHKLLIFVTVLLIPVFLGLLVGFVYGLAIGFLMGLISPKLSVLLSLLDIFITVFTIGFLSTTYEYIMSLQPEKEENETSLKGIEYEENGESYRVNIDDRYDITFDDIKKSLLKQYESLGFTNIKLDKIDSWLLKNPEIEKAYILLTHSKNQYTVETFNIDKKPIINIDEERY